MTLSGASTFANYQAALALVRFAVSGDNPTNYGANTTRTFAWSVATALKYSFLVYRGVLCGSALL
jgi:hypothetical protein